MWSGHYICMEHPTTEETFIEICVPSGDVVVVVGVMVVVVVEVMMVVVVEVMVLGLVCVPFQTW